jgi:hypothetical protein
MPAALAAIPSNGMSPMISSLVFGLESQALVASAERTGLRTPEEACLLVYEGYIHPSPFQLPTATQLRAAGEEAVPDPLNCELA